MAEPDFGFDQLLAAFQHQIRSILTGSWVRKVGGIRDIGELLLVKVANIDAGALVEAAEDLSDLWVHVQDEMRGAEDEQGLGHPHLARLFAAGNMVWRKPRDGDGGVLLRPAGVDGPGVPV